MANNNLSQVSNERQALEPNLDNPVDLCPFNKIMVANRGEIATRIFRAAAELNLKTVSIYGYEDRFSAHRWYSDESYLLPESGTPVGAYLNIENIIKIAKDAEVDAIHPGYGFLAESAEFAQVCEDNEIVFVGPSVASLNIFGDKTKARELAISAKVSVVPGTEGIVNSSEEALAFVEKYGLPVMIKAAKGGGGKGMRVVREKEDLLPFFKAASSEALASFGDGSCFIERYVSDAKHVEIQVLGDGKGNVIHLYERDCSIQRRHQKLIEIAPAWHHPMDVRKRVQEDALKLTRACNYLNAGTVEFLIDDLGRHYFMEVNPRVQVEHTVTEEVTGIDIVQTTFLLAGGATFKQLGLNQEDITPRGVAVQARITTEDPAKDFAPDTGLLDVCRHSLGVGVRVDGTGYGGLVVQPHYDSLLVKYSVRSSTWESVIRRLRRVLIHNHIRGVKTNIPFLLNVLAHPEFIKGNFNLNFLDQNPYLLDTTLVPYDPNNVNSIRTSYQKLDEVEGMLKYISNLIINGHPTTLGADVQVLEKMPNRKVPPPDLNAILRLKATTKAEDLKAPKWRKLLREQGADVLAKAVREHSRVLLTDTTWRDAHQSLLATRMRTYDLLQAAEATNVAYSGASDIFSVEMWGGATFDVSMRFLHECPWRRLEALRAAAPDVPFQMLLRGANAVGYTSYPDNVIYAFCKQAYESGIDIFRVFDSLNYVENLELGIDAVVKAGGFCEATICYTGDVTNTSPDNKYGLSYYIDIASKLVKMGTHALGIKDMAGLMTPRSAKILISALRKEFPDTPIHVHTHDTGGVGVSSMIAAADSGADIVDGAIDSMSGLSSQPCLGAIVSSVGNGHRGNNLDIKILQILNQYWENVRSQYAPFEVRDLPAAVGSSVFAHEIPGGQYTNLLFQSKQLGLAGRFGEVKEAYALANQLLGDIPKVTPSSKTVGDLAQFIIGMKLSGEEVIENASTLSLPNSVVEYFQGALGPPPGGFPEKLRANVLKGRTLPDGRQCYEGRPGAEMPPYDFEAAEAQLKEAFGENRITFRDVLSHALYPSVFKEWMAFEKIYGALDNLPTNVFLQPLGLGEEILFSTGKGKDFYVRLAAIDKYDDDTGSRQVTLEVNGERWFMRVIDDVTPLKLAAGGGGAFKKRREKVDPTSKKHVGCTMPGVIVEVSTKVGDEVTEGQSLLVMSAMKMETEIKTPVAGTVKRVLVESGDSVETDDLLVEIE